MVHRMMGVVVKLPVEGAIFLEPSFFARPINVFVVTLHVKMLLGHNIFAMREINVLAVIQYAKVFLGQRLVVTASESVFEIEF